jgi:hypothetical protein
MPLEKGTISMPSSSHSPDRITAGKLPAVHVSSASELENYLSTHHPESLEIEYHESDTLLGTWSELPEFPLLQVERHFGYRSVHRRDWGGGVAE